MKSFFKKLLFSNEVLEKVYSPINGEILVTEDLFGSKEMKVGGVTQSGGLVGKLWNSIFNYKFLKTNFKCLILGLGGGTLASLISKKFPQVKIKGVELDQKVVEIGKKYFGLGEIKNLEIIVGDATKIKLNNKFGLIIVDLYLGQEFPKEAESDIFLDYLKNILEKNGLIIFNRLNFGSHKKETSLFKDKLIQSFPCLICREIDYNLLLFASIEAQKIVYC